MIKSEPVKTSRFDVGDWVISSDENPEDLKNMWVDLYEGKPTDDGCWTKPYIIQTFGEGFVPLDEIIEVDAVFSIGNGKEFGFLIPIPPYISEAGVSQFCKIKVIEKMSVVKSVTEISLETYENLNSA